ncbi:type II toxin-antitoxin system RnlB family antitoxin [Staphylococcus pettenkoferi]|uniref:type II toxin-antitoxin system RnlB family antitoxin n=1 Tax=Staphylococcus pettenkoferi TaxID=170573 RepID=UPI0022739DF2|nr:type II toxin-antitoxin system RnlB family antitoxin [Staphylococcus pettenkoferi]MCY1598009.1 type II toxin-antitoxin system RnlB family antitoxin [Staphylococcus pettenkoferi]
MVVKLNNIIDGKTVIILKDKYKAPSHQLREIGEREYLDGLYIFDLLLIKGNISNRFIKVEFINGKLNLATLKYFYLNKDEIKKVNEKINEKVDKLDNYLTRNEIKNINSFSIV